MSTTLEQHRSVLTRFNPSMAKDEMNLCEFPLGFLGKKPPKGVTTLEFRDRAWDVAGQCYVQQKRTILGSEKYGLPRWFDDDVLLALIQLSKLQSDFQSPRVDFSRYQIVQLLDLDGGGDTYQRIKESILRMYAVTIECERSWYIKEKKQWCPGTKPIRIFADAHVYAESDSDPTQSSLSLSYVEFSQQIFESLSTGFVRTFDLDRYNRLKTPAAKRAMRYLGKCWGRLNPWEEDFRTFSCERLGFSRKYDNSNLKRQSELYIADLENNGVIKPMPFEQRITKGDKRGVYNVLFEPAASSFLPSPTVIEDALKGVATELVSRGITKKVALDLVQHHSQDYIQAKIEFVDWEIEQGKKPIDSPGGYLRSAIEQDFQPPKAFKSKAQLADEKAKDENRKKKLKDQEAAFNKQRAAMSEADERRVTDLLKTLNDSQRVVLERAAIKDADKFLKDRYWKAYNKSPDVEQEVKAMIIHAHVLRLLESSDEPFTLKRAG